MTAPDLLLIAAIALGAAVVVGAVALPVLRGVRRASLTVQVVVVVAAAILAVAAGTAAVTTAMLVSTHDLLVTLSVAAMSSVIALALAVLLGRRLATNVERLRVATRALGEGAALREDAHAGGSAELGALTAELARTSARLASARQEVAALDASRRELVAWISHDLRTPLAGLRATTEALEDGLADDPGRAHRRMLAQIDALSAMVDDLFELSKIQSGRMRLEIEPVSVYDLLSDAVADVGALASAKRITIEHEPAGELVLHADQRELARVVGNLLGNAIRHTPPGGRIRLAATRTDGDAIVLSVQDTAGGIPEHELARIFEPGWRGSTARTPDDSGGTHGAGLGLAIVRGIVGAHDGDVTVRNVPGGSRFEVRLPGRPASAV
jgi:signal transduction histidine kinase